MALTNIVKNGIEAHATSNTDFAAGSVTVCDDEDVVVNQSRGCHLREWITVLEGIDEVEEAAARKSIRLTENQKGIVRLLRKHGQRTPRQLADGLSVLSATIAADLEALMRAGLVICEGNSASKKIRLTPPVP